MASKYWIKLYHEILDDPKMGRLRPLMWQTLVKLFLVAGEHGKGGALPCVEDCAWRLRVNKSQMAKRLQELSSGGFVKVDDSGQWIVTNFAKRQAASTNAERAKRYRQRHKDSNESVTKPKRKVTPDTDTDTDTDNRSKSGGDFQKVSLAYQNEIGGITAIISDGIKEALQTAPADWIIDAIGIAAQNNKRNWGYVKGILRRWDAEGRGASAKPKNKSTSNGRNAQAIWDEFFPRRLHRRKRVEDWGIEDERAIQVIKAMGKNKLCNATEQSTPFVMKEFIQRYEAVE